MEQSNGLPMLKNIHSKLFYVSPWLFASATGLLVMIIVTFAAMNIQREKKLMTNSMLQKAVTVMRFVHSGARGSYVTALKTDIWNPGTWTEHAQKIINHVAEDPNIMFLAIVDENGTALAHSDKNKVGVAMSFPLPDSEEGTGPNLSIMGHRVVVQEGVRTFETAHRFFPYRPAMAPMIMRPGRGMRHNFNLFGNNHDFGHQHPQEPPQDNLKTKYYIVSGLDMGEFDKSLVRVKMQIFILSIAMLLVGVGGWLSLTAVQGFRVSQKTLAGIKAFTGHLISKLPVGIVAIDQKGRITTWNKVAASMTGLSSFQTVGRLPAEVLPSELSEFFAPDKAGRARGLLRDTGREREKEIRMVIEDREQVLYCQLIDILDNDSDYIGQVLMISNLTVLKKMESDMREHERLAAVGRMAAGVAHEVRNPLSSIKGLALLLKDKFKPESREHETASLLIQEVERMNRTISELLSFARPPSLNLQKLNLSDLLSESLKLISSDAESSDIRMQSLIDPDLNTVYADRDRLNQVFINILLNGVQAMEDGGILTLEAANRKDDNGVVIRIIDTGDGIDEKDLKQVFFPYFTTKRGGTGIGLAISQKIISDHHGTIKIESEKRKGTTVTIELPGTDDRKS